jgi:signal transduction histidine kinase
MLYALVSAPLLVAQAYVTALLWVESLATLTYPLWFTFQPSHGGHYNDPLEVAGVRWAYDAWPGPVLVALAGAVTLVATAWLVRGIAELDLLRIAALLGGGPGGGTRVRQLTERRDQAVTQAASQLRRIERDLHDGAQARMVTLAMELGRVRAQLESGAAPADAATRIAAVHEEAKLALGELRDLARGIYPAVLTDLGLDGAVPLLTARCPVPTTADLDIPRRPDGPVEATAYFCIAELLTNVAKHSGAGAASVQVRRRGSFLRVDVCDDGTGGAAARPGSGLAGLAERVNSVDGRLVISSPAGGPTTITVELPCES